MDFLNSKDTVTGNDIDLEKVISFSSRFISQTKSLKEMLDRFVYAVKDELGYHCVELYCFYRYTISLERAATTDESLPKKDKTRLKEIIDAGKVIVEQEREGRYTVYLPVVLPRGAGWREVEPDLDADNSTEFTQTDILITVTDVKPTAHSINILNLIGMEIAYASEMYELFQYDKNMMDCLIQTHYISMNALGASDESQLFSIWKDAEIVKRLFDGMALWLTGESEGLNPYAGYFSDNVKSFDINKYTHGYYCAEPMEIYDLGISDCYSVILCPLINGKRFVGAVGFFKSYERKLRPAEKAAALIISHQISYNIESIYLHKDLEYQNIELRFEKDFSEKVFASISSGIIVIDEKGKILTANPYALNHLEFTLEEMAGSNLESLVPGLLHDASETQGEGIYTIRDNKEIYLGFTMSRLQGSEGLTGKIIIFRDITEVMSLRKQLKRKEYFSAIGKMASWIAHEVRNPIFAIASITKILQKKAQDEEQERFFNAILRETQTLKLLVDDLLMYGKPLGLKPKRMAVCDLLGEILDGMKPYVSENGGELRITVDTKGLYSDIDGDRMKQVFYNLIKNALEAGADRITIDVYPGKRMMTFVVIDNGKGIMESDLAEMFTPFFTTKKSGTGLGLPVCRKIVEEHGGNIRITSEPGHGTEVRIELKSVE